jgi:glyoxylase-like metal-dependent hydrolase (beta-lactamase superfamily II)
MLIAGFPAGAFQTNCFLVAPGPRSEAVVIDPGQDAVPGVEELCDRHHLRLVAAVITHGHLDHMWSVTPLAGAHGIPAYVHPDDRHLLSDPLAGMGPELRAMLPSLTLAEPDDVRPLTDGQVLDLAGVRLTVDHTPGHTRGHVTFRSAGAGRLAGPALDAGVAPGGATAGGDGADGFDGGVVFAGDLVFAGSIGRTDLPGGSTEQMLDSIEARFLTLPDETLVLPGHGPRTTVGRERETNPFLARWPRAPGAEARRNG